MVMIHNLIIGKPTLDLIKFQGLRLSRDLDLNSRGMAARSQPARRRRRIAAHEGGAARAAMLGAAAGAASPKPTEEPVGDRAPDNSADLAG